MPNTIDGIYCFEKKQLHSIRTDDQGRTFGGRKEVRYSRSIKTLQETRLLPRPREQKAQLREMCSTFVENIELFLSQKNQTERMLFGDELVGEKIGWWIGKNWKS